MRIKVPLGETLTPQQAYNRVNARIAEIEDDKYEIETVLRLLGHLKRFLEEKHVVE